MACRLESRWPWLTSTMRDPWRRDRGELRIATAVLRLAQDDPRAALTVLVPVLDGCAPLIWPAWLAQAFLLEAVARDTLGDPGAANRALERALDVAEPDGVLLCFLLHRVPGLAQQPLVLWLSANVIISFLCLPRAGRASHPPRGGRRTCWPLPGSASRLGPAPRR